MTRTRTRTRRSNFDSERKQGYFAYIVFRFAAAAAASIFNATDKRNWQTLYDERRPLFDVSCRDFVARPRNNTPRYAIVILSREIPCRNASPASSYHGKVTNPRKFRSLLSLSLSHTHTHTHTHTHSRWLPAIREK